MLKATIPGVNLLMFFSCREVPSGPNDRISSPPLTGGNSQKGITISSYRDYKANVSRNQSLQVSYLAVRVLRSKSF